MHLCAGMVSALVKLFFTFYIFDLHNTALDDMRSIAFDESVDHPRAADETDLPNGKGQKRMLFRAVQCAFCVQQPCKAAGARQLAFQLLLIEPFAAKDLDSLCNVGQYISVFLQLRNARDHLWGQRLRTQPVGCFIILCGFSAKPQHDRLMESGKLDACKFPDRKV